MGRLLPGEGITPTHWFVAFSRKSDLWWARWLAFGHYCHVSAFGHVAAFDCWLFVDVTRSGLIVRLVPEGGVDAVLAPVLDHADVIHVEARPSTGWPHWPVYCCTVAIRHLIGASGGALRPDRLWRDLLEQGGGAIFHAREHTQTESGAIGSDAGADQTADGGRPPGGSRD